MTVNFACIFYKWFNQLNLVEILISGIVGSLIGWLMSELIANKKERIRIKNLEALYKPITGKYACKYKNDPNRKISEAVIKYISENELKIELSTFIERTTGFDFPPEDIQRWSGEIFMRSIRHGEIIWEYIHPKNIEEKDGCKRIIISKDFNSITLIGEGTYGNERLEKINS